MSSGASNGGDVPSTPKTLLIAGRPYLLDRRVELMRWLRWRLPAHHILIHWALS